MEEEKEITVGFNDNVKVTLDEPPKKKRGWPKGKKRGPRKARSIPVSDTEIKEAEL